MKAFTILLLLIALCCTCPYPAPAQKAIRKTRKPSKPRFVCSVDAVPQGMVIVGYQDNAVCATGRELLVKRPVSSETVCANSPVPRSYSVQNVTGSIDCRDASPNPLTNALVITRGAQDVFTSIASGPSYTRASSSVNRSRPGCDPNYSGCVPIASDVDCAGGDGDGPAYVSGPIRVIGRDIYHLDGDGDGIACEGP